VRVIWSNDGEDLDEIKTKCLVLLHRYLVVNRNTLEDIWLLKFEFNMRVRRGEYFISIINKRDTLLFNLLKTKSLYMFRALLVHLQEAQH
jgi:hypothetical protein